MNSAGIIQANIHLLRNTPGIINFYKIHGIKNKILHYFLVQHLSSKTCWIARKLIYTYKFEFKFLIYKIEYIWFPTIKYQHKLTIEKSHMPLIIIQSQNSRFCKRYNMVFPRESSFFLKT
jgi:hypothetical protein